MPYGCAHARAKSRMVAVSGAWWCVCVEECCCIMLVRADKLSSINRNKLFADQLNFLLIITTVFSFAYDNTCINRQGNKVDKMLIIIKMDT